MSESQNQIITGNLDWKEGKISNFFGKELLDLENGSVKLVKIKPDAAYPLHIHPDKTEYVYVIKGRLHCKIDSREYEGKEGDFFIFPKKKEHSIANCSQEDCVLLVGAIKS